MQESDWRSFTERLFRQNQFAVKLGLDNMRAALESCDHPERSHPAILVAGTNGKGSTAAILASVLIEHGLRVGLYTSPHLIDFTERFRVQGSPLPKSTVYPIGTQVLAAFGDITCDTTLTYFELTTLMAARLFQGCDVSIYEVGLGGRLDAVNAIEPALSVITTLGFDHQNYLGESIEEIAGEKAGIMRSGVPVIVGEQEHEGALAALCLEAQTHGAPVEHPLGHSDGRQRSDWRARHRETALCAARVFLGEAFHETRARRGVELARWPGRMERRSEVWRGEQVSMLLDAAHNPDGVRGLVSHVLEVDAVLFGVMADKDHGAMYDLLQGLEAPVYGVEIDNSRALTGEGLAALVGVSMSFGSIVEALDEVVERGHRRVLICGSMYLLGELYQALGRGDVDMASRAVS